MVILEVLGMMAGILGGLLVLDAVLIVLTRVVGRTIR